jgi:hypothetical protein
MPYNFLLYHILLLSFVVLSMKIIIYKWNLRRWQRYKWSVAGTITLGIDWGKYSCKIVALWKNFGDRIFQHFFFRRATGKYTISNIFPYIQLVCTLRERVTHLSKAMSLMQKYILYVPKDTNYLNFFFPNMHIKIRGQYFYIKKLKSK